MKPSEIDSELLEQHASIRIMMDVTQTIAEGARLGSRGGAGTSGVVSSFWPMPAFAQRS